MGRRRVKDMQVICQQGTTSVLVSGMEATYTYRKWLFQVNPALLPPAWRRGHKKVIRVDGKKRGTAEVRQGMAPLKRFDIPGTSFNAKAIRWIRRNLGFMLNEYEQGYIWIRLCGFTYVILTSETEAGFTTCDVYDLNVQLSIGKFTFDKDFKEVYVSTGTEGVSNTLQVILGYVADTVVYSSAALGLDKTIDINFF